MVGNAITLNTTCHDRLYWTVTNTTTEPVSIDGEFWGCDVATVATLPEPITCTFHYNYPPVVIEQPKPVERKRRFRWCLRLPFFRWVFEYRSKR